MAHPSTSPANRHITLAELKRIKQWQLAHKDAHPLEHQVWDIVLTLWVMGWAGLLGALALEAPWAFPLCLLGMVGPRLYVYWRTRAHETRRLRCDWLNLVA